MGLAVGAAFAVWLCYQKRQFLGEFIFYLSIICGVFFFAAMHLTLCSFYPDHLVHYEAEDGTRLNTEGYTAKLGDVHKIEIFAAGIVVMVTAVHGLAKIKRRVLAPAAVASESDEPFYH